MQWTNDCVAKHLEPLKGGKIPLEILVRGKDAEQNEKLFNKITDLIKSSGVGYLDIRQSAHH